MRQMNSIVGGGPGERADFLQRLAPDLRKLIEEQQLGITYEKIDLPLAAVIADMERVGIAVDPKALETMSLSMEKEVRRLEKEIWALAGAEFNVNSPTQLADILFDKLALQPPARRGAGKLRSTAADVLEKLAEKHPLPAKIIEYREIAKLKSTYVDSLPKLIHPETKRLHTSLSQTGTATGRLSSSDPNLQNIPIRSELGRQIRAAFVAEKGKILLAADYSQLNYASWLIFLTIRCYWRRSETAKIFTHEPPRKYSALVPWRRRQNTAARRKRLISELFMIVAVRIGAAAQYRAKRSCPFINAYFLRYRGVKEYLDNVLMETRKTAMTRTLFGRIRPIPEITSPQVQLRNFAERTALNSPLQGTAADLIKLAMIAIDKRLTAEKLEAKMILQVHDELLFEAPKKERENLESLVKEEMEGVYELAVPLVVEVSTGLNWRDMD